MATNTTITSFAHDQFGAQASEVVRAVVGSMSEAQSIGCRVQETSHMSKRHPYGSVWPLKYKLLVESLRDLEGVEVLSTDPAIYELVRVNGRLLVPFKLASSLADIPRRPQLSSAVLLARAAQSAPKPEPDITLFDDPLAEESASDSEVADENDNSGHPPLFIGVVANADSDTLLAIYWGTAVSISEDGILEWAPESMPLQLVPEPRANRLQPVSAPTGPSARSFLESDVPDLMIGVRDTPVDEPATPDPIDEDPLPRPSGEQDE